MPAGYTLLTQEITDPPERTTKFKEGCPERRMECSLCKWELKFTAETPEVDIKELIQLGKFPIDTQVIQGWIEICADGSAISDIHPQGIPRSAE